MAPGNVFGRLSHARRDASSRRDNWDKPAKGDNPDRKSYVVQGREGWAQGHLPRLGKSDMQNVIDKGMKGW